MLRTGTGKPQVFLLDVDGVMTDGSFLTSVEGKFAKRFGADDHDALSMLRPHVEVGFVSGDHRGFEITRRRIADEMKMPLELVSTVDRMAWIRERYDPANVIYMGDGIFDSYVFQEVGYAISVVDALESTRRLADYVTTRRGGDRAVAEAALHLLDKFFEPFDPTKALRSDVAFSGHWKQAQGTALKIDPHQVAEVYFAHFANKRLDALAALFDANVTLLDWDTHAEGRDAVLAACKGIFDAVGKIQIEVRALFERPGGVAAQLAIEIEGVGSLQVIDLLDINAQGKITAINAFKGGNPA